MARVSIKFTLSSRAPADKDEAARLSTVLTRDYGQQGWEPVSTVVLADGRLLVTWKMNED